MRNYIIEFFTHKTLYISSISVGAIASVGINFFADLHTRQLFGISLMLWFLALTINVIDIHTGIKADTKRKTDDGGKFVFESGKGWRAIEKIFIFTVIMAFIYYSELESIRLHFPDAITTVLLTIKLIAFFYVVLIEIQSIGENQQVRFGCKGKGFLLLDNIIEIVNDGLKNKIKGFFNTKQE